MTVQQRITMYIAILSDSQLYSISILICTLLSLTVILSHQLAIARALYSTVQLGDLHAAVR